MKYRVEIFVDNNWCRCSSHKNKDFAIINAETVYKSRNCDVRVIFEGAIIEQWFKQ